MAVFFSNFCSFIYYLYLPQVATENIYNGLAFMLTNQNYLRNSNFKTGFKQVAPSKDVTKLNLINIKS